MSESEKSFFKDNYGFSINLALALHKVLLCAVFLVALMVIGTFTIGVYAVFVKGSYLLAIVWFVLSVMLFIALRKLTSSSQKLIKETNILMKTFANCFPELQSDSIKKLNSEVAQLCRFVNNS